MTPRPVEVPGLLRLIHLHRLAADSREALPAHVRIDDGGVSVTVETDDAIVMIRLADAVEDTEALTAAVNVQHLSVAALRALDDSRRLREDVAIDVTETGLHFVIRNRKQVSVALLDVEPVDRRRHLAEVLTQPRVPAIGDYPVDTVEALRRIAGVDLELQTPVPDGAEHFDDETLIECLRRQPGIHWGSRILAVVHVVRDR